MRRWQRRAQTGDGSAALRLVPRMVLSLMMFAKLSRASSSLFATRTTKMVANNWSGLPASAFIHAKPLRTMHNTKHDATSFSSKKHLSIQQLIGSKKHREFSSMHAFSSSSSSSLAARPYSSAAKRGDDENWDVPNYIAIPEDQIDISFSRSSGAGGQNVNKVNTKVEVRFHVMSAHWIPYEVRERICQQQSNRMNKDGYLSIQCQESRTQVNNRKIALSKLQDIILQAYPRPKVRKVRKGISKKAKERNIEQKRRRSDIKKSRSSKIDFY